MIDSKLMKLQHFFEADLMIKKEMLNIAPPSDDQYYDVVKYSNKVNDFLDYIFSELKCISSDIFGLESLVMEKITTMESDIKKMFYSCGCDINKLRLFYKDYISNMELKFINNVKKQCVGYSLWRGFSSAMGAKTINEILHFLHSYILNNEYILNSMPLINEKKKDSDSVILLRGVKVQMFEQLFALFPKDLDVGMTDMVAVNERKLLMMVRDRGHALTIEITLNLQTARIEYFIPKICNVDMVNNLPGINKVNQESVGATGVIEVPISDLPNTLFSFISKVPTDSDIIMKNRSMR